MKYYEELRKIVELGIGPYTPIGLNALEQGKSYWTYYFSRSNRRDMLRDYTGVFEVVPSDFFPSSHDKESKYWRFTIKSDTSKWGKTIAGNIDTYMNGYGSAYCIFYDNKELAIQAHDYAILSAADGQTLDKRAPMLRKIINKANTLEISSIETRSLEWYKNLSPTEKEMCDWIKRMYNE